jgi:hypothetical protein
LSVFLMAAETAAHGQAARSRDGAGRERRQQQILDRRFPEITATRGYLQNTRKQMRPLLLLLRLCVT